MILTSLKMTLATILILVWLPQVSSAYSPRSDFSLLRTVKGHLKHEYVEKDLDEKKLEYGAIKGLLASLDDPYSRFIEPKNFNEMKIRMKGEFFGIGIHIGMRKDRLTVISPIAGTPAYKAGLRAMDKIMTIDKRSTTGLSLTEAVNLIRGEKGTPVVLGIQRGKKKQPFDVTIIRDKIEIKAVDKQEVFRDQVGYIRLTTFENHNATYEVGQAIRNLMKKNVSGLILDLRNNGGGLLRNAINIANFFLKDAEVVYTVDRDGKRITERVYGRALYENLPLVIMINEGSASASEILAGAIKDNDRGKVVGRSSFGKASVQKILNLPDGSAVLFTIAKYLTPNGTDITKTGITVNIEAKIPSEDIEMIQKPDYVYSYDKDHQLQRAIDIIQEDIKEYAKK